MRNFKKFFLPFLITACILTGCGGGNGNSAERKTEKTGVTTEAQATEVDSSATVIFETPSEKNTEKDTEEATEENDEKSAYDNFDIGELPAYSGEPYTVVNDNTPFFTESELKEAASSYEKYSDLDALGRCGVCVASVGQDIMPTEERGAIGSIKPTGWHTVKYDCVDGKYLYNRCHLLGYQLTAENANEENLITGTRYLNIEGMLPFENMVADYVKETDNHVLYRVTPIFQADNLVASGVLMEAESVEDNGESVLFNVYCYNVQPGVTIDYATGESKADGSVSSSSEKSTKKNKEETKTTSAKNDTGASTSRKNKKDADDDAGETYVWIPSYGSKYHSNAGCSNMKSPSKVALEEAESMGYEACKKCY